MFSPNVVGNANATAAGWGNLGGGVTQIFMIFVLFNPMVNSGMAADTAWRVSMIIPAVLFLICAAAMKLLCWDTPTAKRFDVAVTGKVNKPSMWDYVEVLKDVRVVVMIFQYSACFGTELAMKQTIGDPLQDLFPAARSRCFCVSRSFWSHEPVCQVTGWNQQRHPLSSTWDSVAAFGHNSWPFSLRPSSSSASGWWTIHNLGMLHLLYLFASLCLSRWLKAQAALLEHDTAIVIYGFFFW